MEVPFGMAPLIGAIPQRLGLLLSLLSRSQFLAPKSYVANGSLKVERFPTCCRLTAVYISVSCKDNSNVQALDGVRYIQLIYLLSNKHKFMEIAWVLWENDLQITNDGLTGSPSPQPEGPGVPPYSPSVLHPLRPGARRLPAVLLRWRL